MSLLTSNGGGPHARTCQLKTFPFLHRKFCKKEAGFCTPNSFRQLSLVGNRTLVDTILFDDLAIVEHVELFRRIFTCKQHDCLFAPWMVREELCHLVNIVTDYDPAIGVRRVFRNLGGTNRHAYVSVPQCKDGLT